VIKDIPPELSLINSPFWYSAVVLSANLIVFVLAFLEKALWVMALMGELLCKRGLYSWLIKPGVLWNATWMRIHRGFNVKNDGLQIKNPTVEVYIHLRKDLGGEMMIPMER
jgi:hypothetical protein